MNRSRASIVNTTIDCIVDTFYRGYDRRDKCRQAIIEALIALSGDIKSEDGKFSLSQRISLDKRYMGLKKDTPPEVLKEFSYHEPLKYEVEASFDNHAGFTKLNYIEYDYINHWCRQHNQTEKTRIDSVKVLNMYMTLKLHIARNESFAKEHSEKAEAYMSIKTLGKKLGSGVNTVQKYLDVLQSMKMITVTPGNFKDRKSNIYRLDDSWIKRKKEKRNEK